MAGISLALGNMSPAQAVSVLELDEPQPVTEESTEARRLGQEFLQTASEMWMLLSGVSSKQDADAAAAREILVTEMENAVKLKVALKVGVAEGDNWYDCH